MLAESEEYRGRNLITHAWKYYGEPTSPPVPKAARDRKVRPADNNASWERSVGICTGCGTAVISPAQRERLHRAMKADPGIFNMKPTYLQHNGEPAPLWSIVTKAARGIAEHVVPRSQGGPTRVRNLTNVCAGCNYARMDRSLDAMRVAAYKRPAVELL